MDDRMIQARIAGLVEREHQLRQGLTNGTLSREAEHEQLTAAEEELDQCWDLLRQRRARREFRRDAGEAQAARLGTPAPTGS